MHTGQILLVEAETEEEALDKVRSVIEYGDEVTPRWSDWHEIGGRWKDIFGKHGVVLRYSKDEELANEKIHEWSQGRVKDMLRSYEEVKKFDLEKAIAEYNPESASSFDMNSYYLKKVASILNDDWTAESGVYDLESWTGVLKHFRERVAIAPEMQFLVIVDFHF